MMKKTEVRTQHGAEKTAQAAHERWQVIFDAMLDPMALLGTDGAVRQCNRTFADFLGRDTSSLVGEECHRLIHRTDDHIPGCPLVRARKSGRRETMELLAGQKTFFVVVDPVKGVDGRTTGFVHIMRDITEYKRMEVSLRESEEKYRALLDNSVDAIVIADAMGKFLEANKKGII
ncbi:MAG: PAS domain S-box protein [Pseudomonadota bacterium]